jgi:eukaryotic-like serine/threonine-protein kinase
MKSIGKYQIIEALGSSATAETYRVLDTFRHREFAVKVLKTVPNLTTEAKQQFCDYLSSCAELTHRHIAKITDLGEVEEGIFVVTEWRAGIDLRTFLEQHPDLPLDQKLGIIAQVAEGLAFAHSRGIAHGNLKPGNIYVDASRDASIVDFGIAKWLGALIEAGCRPEGLLPNYLAPEQVLGQPFDARSDIFALGLMLYECAAGKYPFSSDAGLIPRDIVHSEPAGLRSCNAQIPEHLEQLVAHALHKDPSLRLQTAEEFASGLYVAAQHLRRATAPPATEAAGEPSSDRVQIPPALAPAFEAPPEAPKLQLPALEIPATPRERPQDAEPEPRPWTARSYANAPLGKDASAPPAAAAEADAAKAPAPRARPLPPPMAAPEFVPPQSFLQPPLPPPLPALPKKHKLGKAILVSVAGLILAVILAGMFLSRQNLKASQSRIRVLPAPAVTPDQVAQPGPTSPQPAVPATAAAKSEPKDAEQKELEQKDTINAEASAKQILNGPVRTLWESGHYSQAMALVDRILSNDPSDEAALSWKKKIREAQAAEAALK